MSLRRALSTSLAGLVLTSLGCGPSAYLAVEICGDVRIPDDVDAVRLVVRGDGASEISAGYVDLLDPWAGPEDPCPAIVQRLPLSFDVVEGRGEVVVTAEGLHEGVVRMRSHARADFPVRGRVPVTLSLERACVGISCATGQTCLSGRCERAPYGASVTCPEPAPYIEHAERCPPEDEEEEDVEEEDA